MITEALYITLFVIAFTLFIYSIVDTNNRLYCNIVTMFLATILFIVLSLFSTSGDLQTSGGTIIQNAPLGYLCLVCGIITGIIATMMIIEVIIETYKKGEEELGI